MKKNIIIRAVAIVFASAQTAVLSARDIVWFDGKSPVTYSIPKKSDLVVATAVDMFVSDMKAVTGMKAELSSEKNAVIRIVELDRATPGVRKQLSGAGVPVADVEKRTDGFHISVINGQITVAGANGRGTAYGILELSRSFLYN